MTDAPIITTEEDAVDVLVKAGSAFDDKVAFSLEQMVCAEIRYYVEGQPKSDVRQVVEFCDDAHIDIFWMTREAARKIEASRLVSGACQTSL